MGKKVLLAVALLASVTAGCGGSNSSITTRAQASAVPSTRAGLIAHFAGCMRSHGISGFRVPSGQTPQSVAKHLDVKSAKYQTALSECHSQLLAAVVATG